LARFFSRVKQAARHRNDLADLTGSVLYEYVKTGKVERELGRRRNWRDFIPEIVTSPTTDAFEIDDEESFGDRAGASAPEGICGSSTGTLVAGASIAPATTQTRRQASW
jgi:hypothetical protein